MLQDFVKELHSQLNEENLKKGCRPSYYLLTTMIILESFRWSFGMCVKELQDVTPVTFSTHGLVTQIFSVWWRSWDSEWICFYDKEEDISFVLTSDEEEIAYDP